MKERVSNHGNISLKAPAMLPVKRATCQNDVTPASLYTDTDMTYLWVCSNILNRHAVQASDRAQRKTAAEENTSVNNSTGQNGNMVETDESKLNDVPLAKRTVSAPSRLHDTANNMNLDRQGQLKYEDGSEFPWPSGHDESHDQARIIPDRPDNITENDETGKEHETDVAESNNSSECNFDDSAACCKNSVSCFVSSTRINSDQPDDVSENEENDKKQEIDMTESNECDYDDNAACHKNSVPYFTNATSCVPDVRIVEVHPYGRYIRLRNTSQTENKDVGGHYLLQTEKKQLYAIFQFPPIAQLPAGGDITVWSGSAGPGSCRHLPEAHYFFTSQPHWASGPHCTTVLCRPNEKSLLCFATECENQKDKERKLQSSFHQQSFHSASSGGKSRSHEKRDDSLINEDSRNQLSKDGKSKGTEKKESSAESAWQSAHEQLTSDSERLSSAVPGQPSDLPPKNVVGEHGVDSKHHLNEDNGQRASLAISKGKNNQQPPVSSAESQRNDLNEQSNAEFPHQPEVTAAHEDEQLHKHGKELETNSNIARKHRSESTYKRSASHLVKRHGKQSELSDRNDLEQKQLAKRASDKGGREPCEDIYSSGKGTNKRTQSILKDCSNQSFREQVPCERRLCNEELVSNCTAYRDCEFSDTDQSSLCSCGESCGGDFNDNMKDACNQQDLCRKIPGVVVHMQSDDCRTSTCHNKQKAPAQPPNCVDNSSLSCPQRCSGEQSSSTYSPTKTAPRMSNVLDENDGWFSSSNDSDADSLEVTVSNKSIAVDDDKGSPFAKETSDDRGRRSLSDGMTLENRQIASSNNMQHAKNDAENFAPVSLKEQRTRRRFRSGGSSYRTKPSPSQHSADEQMVECRSSEKLQTLLQHQRGAHVKRSRGNVKSLTSSSQLVHSSQMRTKNSKQNESNADVSDGQLLASTSVSQFESAAAGPPARDLNIYNDHENVIPQVDAPDVVAFPLTVQSSDPLENISTALKPDNASCSSSLPGSASRRNSSFARQLYTAAGKQDSSNKSLCGLLETRSTAANSAVNCTQREQASVADVGRVKPAASSDRASVKTKNLASRSKSRNEQNRLKVALHYYDDCISCAHCFDFALCKACNSIHCPNGDDDDLDIEPLSHQQRCETSSCILSSAQQRLGKTAAVGHCVEAEHLSQQQQTTSSCTPRRDTDSSRTCIERGFNYKPEILHYYSDGSDFVDSCSAVKLTNGLNSCDRNISVETCSLSCDFILDVIGCTCLVVLITVLTIAIYRHLT